MDENFEIIEEIWGDTPKSFDELERLPLYSILIVIAGYISIGIGTLHFLLRIIEHFRPNEVFYFIINVIFGFALLLSFYRIESDKKRWSILTFIFAIVLIALGGIVGALAGFVAFLGGILAFLTLFTKNFEV